MKTLFKLSKLLFFFGFFFLISCGEDDELPTNDDGPNLEDYYISFDISGSEEGERLGYADFTFNETSAGGTMYTVQLYGADDLTSGVWTWQIKIERFSLNNEEVMNVTTGTFPINEDFGSTTAYRGSYVNIETGVEYTDDALGTITISNITDTYLEGTFAFTVNQQGGGGQVSITNGEFKAKID